MIIDYNKQAIFTKSVDVEDVGNFCLCGTSADGYEYYFIVQTILGKTHILKYGPLITDLPLLIENFTVSYKSLNFNETKILKAVSEFVNDTFKKIEEITALTKEEALIKFPLIVDCFNKIDQQY